VSQEEAIVQRCQRQIGEIRALVFAKLEGITMHHLVFSDRYAGAKNEVQVSAEAGGIGFAMWVNLSKNPRVKDIEFPGLKVEISKGIAMSSLAIRILMIPTKPYHEKYLLLNRLIKCDLLQLPTPPKRIGGMTLRQSPHQSALVVLQYPLKNVQQAQPPLNFKLTLTPGFLTSYMTGATVVMVTDGDVSTQTISKVSVDADANEVTFSSSAIGTFALAIPRYSHFPLKFWEITAVAETQVEIYVQTQLIEFALVINGEGKVSMDSPFQFSGMTPVAAVEFLAEKGVNIIAPPGALTGITAKHADLEDVLAHGLADTVTGFHVKWSKWNALLPADRAMLLMKPQLTFEVEEEDEPEATEPAAAEAEATEPAHIPEGTATGPIPVAESTPAPEAPPPAPKPKMHAILAKANHMTEVPNTEKEEECDLKQAKDTQIHQHLLPLLFDRAPPEVQQRVKQVPGFLCDATYYLLKNLRLFSMSQ
jgi:cancer susceptibility candidate protein 1